MFPLFLFVFEVIFLVIYGLLVRYDEAGAPHHDLAAVTQHTEAGGTADEFARNLDSSISTTKTYPCEQTCTLHVLECSQLSTLWGYTVLLTLLLYSTMGVAGN